MGGPESVGEALSIAQRSNRSKERGPHDPTPRFLLARAETEMHFPGSSRPCPWCPPRLSRALIGTFPHASYCRIGYRHYPPCSRCIPRWVDTSTRPIFSPESIALAGHLKSPVPTIPVIHSPASASSVLDLTRMCVGAPLYMPGALLRSASGTTHARPPVPDCGKALALPP